MKTEEEKQGRQGTSKIIIHTDPSSLNKLFPPSNATQQYSPTLSNMSPQQLSEGVNDAFSTQTNQQQQQQQKANINENTITPHQSLSVNATAGGGIKPTITVSGVNALSSVVISRPPPPVAENMVQGNSISVVGVSSINPVFALPIPKAVLSSKPSLEIKPSADNQNHKQQQQQYLNNSLNLVHNTQVFGYGQEYFNHKPSTVQQQQTLNNLDNNIINNGTIQQSHQNYHVAGMPDQHLARLAHVIVAAAKMGELVTDSDDESDHENDKKQNTGIIKSDKKTSENNTNVPPGTVLTLVHEIYPQKESDREIIQIPIDPSLLQPQQQQQSTEIRLQQMPLQHAILPAAVAAATFNHSNINNSSNNKGNTIYTTLATVPITPYMNNTTISSASLSLRPPLQPQQQGQKGFENALIYKDLSSRISSEAANLNQFQKNGFVIDHKALGGINTAHSHKMLRSMGIATADNNKTLTGITQATSLTLLPATIGTVDRNNASSEVKSNILNISNNNPNNMETTKATSLLHQRLLSSDHSSFPNQPGKLTPNTAQFHSGGERGGGNVPPAGCTVVQGAVEYSRLTNPADKMSVTTSLTLTSSSRVPEKSKMCIPGAVGLRIIPPLEDRPGARMMTSSEAASFKEFGGPNTQQYRSPLVKNLTMSEMQAFPALSPSTGVSPSSMGGDGRKMLLNRTSSNIAIAPAPSTVVSASRAVEMASVGGVPPGSATDHVFASAEGKFPHKLYSFLFLG